MPDPIHDLIPHFDPIDPRSVVDRARRRRRTTLGGIAAVISLSLAVLLVPTVVVPSLAGRAARPADVTAGTPSAPPSAASMPPRSASASPAGACGLTDLPASWKAALTQTRLVPPTSVDLLVRDASTGRALYMRRGTPITVVVVEADGTERKLFDLAADQQPFGVALEGDWAVLSVGGTQNLGVMGVYARKVSGGAITTIAKPPSDGSGYISEVPVLYKGMVYLQTATDLVTEKGTLVAYDLAQGARTQREVPRMNSGMVRWGGTLVWGTRGTKVTTMVDLVTLESVAVPSQLAELGTSYWFSSDGETLVWEGNGPRGGWLRSYRAGWGSVREVQLSREITNPGVTNWGRYATVFVADRYWIVDLESGQYAPLTVEWGGAIATGGRLATAEMPADKYVYPPVYELDLTAVPLLPACTG